MSNACTNARSPLSAKNSMKTKMRPALKNRTIHSGAGITPMAPGIRSAPAWSATPESASGDTPVRYVVCTPDCGVFARLRNRADCEDFPRS